MSPGYLIIALGAVAIFVVSETLIQPLLRAKNRWLSFLPFFECGSARLNHCERVMIKANFPLGQIVATPNALGQLSDEDIQTALCRHAGGDWGDCDPADWHENELSLREGFRLFSVYHSIAGSKFWVITEADRSATTVLMPEDY